ncbi:MAG: hypothetical protein U0229_24750 [Anaeromyxobacter sp.]
MNQASQPSQAPAPPPGGLEGLLLRLRGQLLSWLARVVPEEHQHLFVVTVIVGLVCGLVAVAFHLAIQLAEAQLVGRAIAAGGWQGLLLLALSPAIGGLAPGSCWSGSSPAPGARASRR